MTKVAYLLTAADVQRAQTLGVPLRGEGDLWHCADADAFALTVKGEAYLRLVAGYHGVEVPTGGFATYEALARFRYQVSRAMALAAEVRARKALDKGTVPRKDKAVFEAFAYGTTEDLLRTFAQHNDLADHHNVVPLR